MSINYENNAEKQAERESEKQKIINLLDKIARSRTEVKHFYPKDGTDLVHMIAIKNNIRDYDETICRKVTLYKKIDQYMINPHKYCVTHDIEYLPDYNLIRIKSFEGYDHRYILIDPKDWFIYDNDYLFRKTIDSNGKVEISLLDTLLAHEDSIVTAKEEKHERKEEQRRQDNDLRYDPC